MNRVSLLDVAVIAIYLVGITAFGIRVGFRRRATTEQYFLASHSLSWFTGGAAVFTSNISTIHLVGLAAGGAKEGLVIGNFEWMACFTLILLALLFAPFYINSRVKTLPEFMERRYCPEARTFLAIIGVIYFVVDMPGIGRMILGNQAHDGFGGLVTDPIQGLGVPFMLVGPIIAVLCVLIYLTASLLTPAMADAEVSKVCWDHPLLLLPGTAGVLYFILR